MLVLLCILFFLSSCQGVKQLNNRTSLYSNYNAPIVEANILNFRPLVLNKSYAIITQFYSSSCGHCQHFAPIFANFSRQISNWNNVLQLMVVNCADLINQKLCSDYGIHFYPSFLFFKPLSERKTKPLEIKLDQTIDKLYNKSIELLLKLDTTDKDLSYYYSNWPKINLLNRNQITKILFEMETSDSNHTILAFLNKDEIEISTKCILYFSNYIQNITIYNIDYSDSYYLNDTNYLSTDINEYPVLVQFNRNLTLSLVKHKSKYEEFNQFIINNYLSDNWINDDHDLPFLKEIKIQDDFKVDTNYHVYTRDLNNALKYTFMNEIVRFNELTPKQVQILTSFTNNLNKYFPYDNENTRRFLRRISQWFRDRKQNETLKSVTVKAIFKAGAEGYLPTIQPYISCKGSLPHLREYPCSLWLLFHTLTVQEYWHNFNLSKKLNSSTDPLKNQLVLFNIRDYIKYFFSCEVCSQHFDEMSKNLENDLIYLNSSVLWLWNAHNKVNIKLHEEKNEDPNFPKQIFPPYNTCHLCYLNETNIIPSLENIDDFPWNINEVEKFLLNHYHKKNILVKNSSFIFNKNNSLIIILIFITIINYLKYKLL